MDLAAVGLPLPEGFGDCCAQRSARGAAAAECQQDKDGAAPAELLTGLQLIFSVL